MSVHPLGGSRLPNAARPRAVGIVMRDTEATETGVVGSLVVGMSVARAVTTRIAVVTSVASGGGIGTRVAGRTGIGAAIVASPDARPDAGRIAAVATTTTAATTATTDATTATTADTATTGDTAAVVGIVMRDTEATETGEAALRDATPWSPNRCRPETSTRNPDAGSPA